MRIDLHYFGNKGVDDFLGREGMDFTLVQSFFKKDKYFKMLSNIPEFSITCRFDRFLNSYFSKKCIPSKLIFKNFVDRF